MGRWAVVGRRSSQDGAGVVERRRGATPGPSCDGSRRKTARASPNGAVAGRRDRRGIAKRRISVWRISVCFVAPCFVAPIRQEPRRTLYYAEGRSAKSRGARSTTPKADPPGAEAHALLRRRSIRQAHAPLRSMCMSIYTVHALGAEQARLRQFRARVRHFQPCLHLLTYPR